MERGEERFIKSISFCLYKGVVIFKTGVKYHFGILCTNMKTVNEFKFQLLH